LQRRRSGRADGYALVALMIIVTVILISMTETLPGIYQEAQREREEAAIFRGEQYARAIYLFHRTVGRFPSSVKELLNTNGTRYLREAYTDPLSPNGRWHFLHATATGIIIDSQNQTTSPAGQAGAPSSPGAATQPNTNTSSSFGSPGQSNGNTSAFGSFSSQMNSSSSIFGSNNQTGEQSSTTGKKKGPPKPPADCLAQGSATTSSAAQTGESDAASPAQTGELLGAYIVGVAPCSTKESIRVLNKKDHYYQWEFLGINYLPYALPKVQSLQPSSSFQKSLPGQSQPMGSSPNSAFPGTQSNSPQPNQNQNPGGTNE
jgi:hypothetical protein